MENFTAILELALIVALGGVWWTARRDLLALVTRQQTPTLREMERVQASIEQLLERLEAQTEEAERRISASIAVLNSGSDASSSALSHEAGHAPLPPVSFSHSDQDTAENMPAIGEPAGSARYDEVYRLLDAGLDPDEVARRTGLGSGEVRLVVSLRTDP